MAEGDITADADCAVLPDRRANDLTIVSVVLQQLTLLESRIGRKIDDNAAASLGRWKTHDDEHDQLSKAILAIGERLDAHLKAEEREELIFNARIQPVKSTVQLVRREWRTIVIIAMGATTVATQLLAAAKVIP
jgi:hypothetical protein